MTNLLSDLKSRLRLPAQTAEATATIRSSIAEGAKLDVTFVVLTLGSSAIATLGLLENSAAVIIGAMIIAPLLAPIQALAYSILAGPVATIRDAAKSLAAGCILAVGLSLLLSRIIHLTVFGSEVVSRTRPNLLDLGIALAAGAIGGFARTRPGISSTLAGTAIAVALMPPLCVAGIGLAAGDERSAFGALLLFVTNLLGITLASMVVFLLTGHATRKAGPGLIWTLGLTAVIVVPLSLSFETLVREERLESALRVALTSNTVTFRHAGLVASSFDWLDSPPSATLIVRSAIPITPHQVAQLEAFALRATGQRFKLIVDVEKVNEVTAAP